MAPLTLRALTSTLLLTGLTSAKYTTQPTGGQPKQSGQIGQFEIVGESLVSGQQIFLGTLDKVYIVDKTENNPTRIDGHPAWASEFSLSSNKARPVDVITNTFCAGGNVLGNGTWVNVGGNQAVTYGGDPANRQTGGAPYDDPDGRRSIRLLDVCDDTNCDWTLSPDDMLSQRWYPTLETLEDGSIIVLGGCRNGGYVNDAYQDNPTYEFFPSRGDPVPSNILKNTLPVNLYPLTWLLPSGKLLLQANRKTIMLNYYTNHETSLDDMPHAVRTYPASAGTAMLPLTPENNWTATILFCGGSDIANDRWTQNWDIAQYPASDSCVSITPDESSSYVEEDPIPEGRSMGNLIFMPDGKLLLLNGAGTGTAGYGNTSWAIGMSYADNPTLTPAIYDPNAPKGSRWTRDGLGSSTIARMYHSSATLLPDGSILVAGSNPNSDYNVGSSVKYFTEYRLEKFYPSYFNHHRPSPTGIPTQIGYGGDSFDLFLTSDDLSGDVYKLNYTSVILIRTGFSTHGLNMGQRFVELESSYSGYARNNTGVLHVSPLPSNAAILAPGPCLLFVVVDGIPSVGVQVMIGSGELGNQTINDAPRLPESSIESDSEGFSDGGETSRDNRAESRSAVSPGVLFFAVVMTFFTL